MLAMQPVLEGPFHTVKAEKQAGPSISIFNKALKTRKAAEDWKNASPPPTFPKHK